MENLLKLIDILNHTSPVRTVFYCVVAIIIFVLFLVLIDEFFTTLFKIFQQFGNKSKPKSNEESKTN